MQYSERVEWREKWVGICVFLYPMSVITVIAMVKQVNFVFHTFMLLYGISLIIIDGLGGYFFYYKSNLKSLDKVSNGVEGNNPIVIFFDKFYKPTKKLTKKLFYAL